MIGDGLGQHGSLLESRYAFETDQRLRKQYEDKQERSDALKQLQAVTKISEQEVLNELVDCGLRAESLHVLTLFPMVHVAWANGYVERGERLEILKTAEADGMNPESCSYEMLQAWLTEPPEASLLKTWRDYIHAVRRVVSRESFNALRDASMSQASAVAESAGGCFGFGATSRNEQAAIDELRAAFIA